MTTALSLTIEQQRSVANLLLERQVILDTAQAQAGQINLALEELADKFYPAAAAKSAWFQQRGSEIVLVVNP